MKHNHLIMKHAFTLTETLIVILLIAIMASILLPTILKSYQTQKSEIVEIYNNEQQVINVDTDNNILTDTSGYKLVDVKYDNNVIYCIFQPNSD